MADIIEFPSEENCSYVPILTFVDQSKSFVLGFEAGIIWNKMRETGKDFEQQIHVENGEIVQRMADASGYSITLVEHQNNYEQLIFTRTGKKT